jgi:hypothetical protein
VTAIRLTLPDYVVIAGYFIVVLLVGLYFNKKQKAAKDYFAGGHQVPWWLAGISHYIELQRVHLYRLLTDCVYVRLGCHHSLLDDHAGMHYRRTDFCAALAPSACDYSCGVSRKAIQRPTAPVVRLGRHSSEDIR